MTEHVHEWIPWKGEPWFFTCKDENCPRVLDILETTERVNATERLSAEDARFAVKRIEAHIGYEWDDDEGTMCALDAYADILESK